MNDSKTLYFYYLVNSDLVAFTEETLAKGWWNNELYAFDKNGEKIQFDVSSVSIL